MIADGPFFKTRWGWVAVCALLFLGIGLRVTGLNTVAGRSPDESVYTKQANVLLAKGNAGLRELVQEYQADAVARLFPPPTRIGNLWLLAAAMRLTGKNDETVGAYVSCAASIGSVLLLTLFGIRFFPLLATCFALLFFAVSPPELELARRTWGDALIGFLAIGLLYVSAEIQRNPARRIWYVLFVLIGSAGFLVKESWLIVYGLCLAWVLWTALIEHKDRKTGLTLAAAALAGALVALTWLAMSVGGFSTVVRIVPNLMNANASNNYAIEYQSGSGYRLLESFQILSPLPAFLLPIGLLGLLVSERRMQLVELSFEGNLRVARWLGIFVVCLVAVPMILPHWLNLRYMSVVFAPVYLLAGVGFWYCISACRVWLRPSARKPLAALVTILIAACALTDYQRFHRMLVRDGLGDLSVKLILDNRNMGRAEKAVKRSPTADNYLILCRQYSLNARYHDSIAACQNALKLRPDDAEAFSEIAAAYHSLSMWDESIEAAESALRLRPDFPVARYYLDSSLHQRQLQATADATKQ